MTQKFEIFPKIYGGIIRTYGVTIENSDQRNVTFYEEEMKGIATRIDAHSQNLRKCEIILNTRITSDEEKNLVRHLKDKGIQI